MSREYHLKQYDEFSDPEVHKSLKETSKDDTKVPNEFMTINRIRVIDFDEVKSRYLRKRNIPGDNAKSVDSLYMLDNGQICMIEFKNGEFNSSEIIEKSLSSVLIFCDITKNDLSYMRENAVFVLVYNSDVKKVNKRQLAARQKSHRAKDKYSLFGLEHLYRFCFKEVEEIDKEEFDASYYSKAIIQY